VDVGEDSEDTVNCCGFVGYPEDDREEEYRVRYSNIASKDSDSIILLFIMKEKCCLLSRPTIPPLRRAFTDLATPWMLYESRESIPTLTHTRQIPMSNKYMCHLTFLDDSFGRVRRSGCVGFGQCWKI
jgi:hypothetical protein